MPRGAVSASLRLPVPVSSGYDGRSGTGQSSDENMTTTEPLFATGTGICAGGLATPLSGLGLALLSLSSLSTGATCGLELRGGPGVNSTKTVPEGTLMLETAPGLFRCGLKTLSLGLAGLRLWQGNNAIATLVSGMTLCVAIRERNGHR